MSDSFTETTSEGWLSRIGGAFKGMVVGVIACVGSVVLLFWNEGRAVQTAKSLDEGAGAVISVPADNVSAANENKLVHLSAEATTDQTLSDEKFGVTQTALRLQRQVEMYQWKQDEERKSRKKIGGGKETTTTYTYEQVWSAGVIDSDRFKKKAGHTNPKQMPIEALTLNADPVTLGAFKLNPALRGRVHNPSEIDVSEQNIPEEWAGQMTAQGNTLYLGSNPSAPEIGDCRVSFIATMPAQVSVVAQQIGESFQAYQTQAGDPLEMLRMGNHSAEQMFKMAEDDNRMMTWILRGVGAVVMFVGLMMFAKPISVLADVLPFLGSIAEIGLAIVAGLLTITGSCLTIGIAWLFYRPLIGVPLVVVAIGALVMLVKSRKPKPAFDEPNNLFDENSLDDPNDFPAHNL